MKRIFYLTSSLGCVGWAKSSALLGLPARGRAWFRGAQRPGFGRKRLLLLSALLLPCRPWPTGLAGSFAVFVLWRIAGGAAIGPGLRTFRRLYIRPRLSHPPNAEPAGIAQSAHDCHRHPAGPVRETGRSGVCIRCPTSPPPGQNCRPRGAGRRLRAGCLASPPRLSLLFLNRHVLRAGESRAGWPRTAGRSRPAPSCAQGSAAATTPAPALADIQATLVNEIQQV